jgi:hypothetical protein
MPTGRPPSTHTAQLFVLRWNATYPTHPWIDDDTVQHRWVEKTRDKSSVVRLDAVRRMGLLVLHGSWADVVAADGAPIPVTRAAGGTFSAGLYTDELKGMIKTGVMERPCRLVKRDASGDRVVGKATNGIPSKMKGATELFRGVSWAQHADQGPCDLVLQVQDGTVRQYGKTEGTPQCKLLLDGVESFDVSLAHALLTNPGHKLLGEPTDFVELRAALNMIKYDRNNLLCHEGYVSTADFEKAVANIHVFVKACVLPATAHAYSTLASAYPATVGMFDATWKDHLDDAVANACTATWTVNDLEIVCRSAADYVHRSRHEAKTLYHVQVLRFALFVIEHSFTT